jgi:hypothetical protein
MTQRDVSLDIEAEMMSFIVTERGRQSGNDRDLPDPEPPPLATVGIDSDFVRNELSYVDERWGVLGCSDDDNDDGCSRLKLPWSKHGWLALDLDYYYSVNVLSLHVFLSKCYYPIGLQ